MASRRAEGSAYHTLLPVVLISMTYGVFYLPVVLPLPFSVTSRSTELPLVLAA